MQRTFHLALNVTDLDAAVRFYSQLFGTQPAKHQSDYAKFELQDPPVVLALNPAPQTGLSHLGLRHETEEEMTLAVDGLRDRGLVPTAEESGATCCYAKQSKAWVGDPDGHGWEIYTVLSDAPVNRDTASECCTATSEPEVCCG